MRASIKTFNLGEVCTKYYIVAFDYEVEIQLYVHIIDRLIVQLQKLFETKNNGFENFLHYSIYMYD